MMKMKKSTLCIVFLLISFFTFWQACRPSENTREVSIAKGEQDNEVIDTDRRTALIVGNSAYRSSPLKNPANDARGLASALRELGFTVTTLIDADNEKMYQAIRDFGRALTRGDVGLFFFAGHGVQVEDTNYLIPIGADIQEEDEVQFKAIDANLVLNKMESAGNDVNIVILDACRDNQFARSFRSSSREVTAVEAPATHRGRTHTLVFRTKGLWRHGGHHSAQVAQRAGNQNGAHRPVL